MKIITFLLIVCAVFFDGMADGLRNAMRNDINWHWVEIASMISYALAMLTYLYAKIRNVVHLYFRNYAIMCGIMIIEFVAVRFALFDYVHNYFFDVNMLYVGNTSFIDKFYMDYISVIFPPAFLLMLKLFIFIVIFIRITEIFYHGRKNRN